MSKLPRPRDLGNDDFFIRTTTDGVLTDAGLRTDQDLRRVHDRAKIRRFANRLLDMCDYWEERTKGDTV